MVSTTKGLSAAPASLACMSWKARSNECTDCSSCGRMGAPGTRSRRGTWLLSSSSLNTGRRLMHRSYTAWASACQALKMLVAPTPICGH